MSFRLRSLLLASAIYATPVFAQVESRQTQDQGTASPSATDSENQGVQDILVTAQRRSERLQDVPIAITAVTGESLAASGARSSDDLAATVPGLNIKRQTAASLVFVRGVGTAGGQAAQEGAVATFIDGVYQPSPSSTTMALNNIARVEVLKGPQGTLYGRNATGGAINIITLTPSHTAALRGNIGYGNKDTVEGNVYATAGISDGVAVDFAGYYRNQADGFGRNTVTENDVNKGKDIAVRSKILFELSPTTEVTLAGDYEYYKGSEALGQRATTSSTLLNGQVGYTGRFYDINTNVDPRIISRGGGGSLTLVQKLGTVELTSITAYRLLELDTRTDADGTPIPILDVNLLEKNRQFSQELRLAGSSDRFNWIVGGFYLKSRSGYDPFQIVGFAVAPLGLNSLTVNKSLQYTRSLAVFGQATYEILPETRLTLGARYTDDKRKYHGELTGDVIGVGQIALAPPNAFDTSKSFAKPSWRASLDHKFTPDVLGYISYNRGFKSGIYNVTAPGTPPVQPELLDAYEGGLKTTLLDNRLRLNVAGYYYDYKNIQLISQVGAQQLLLNAAKATIYGLDVDFDAALTSRLRVSGGFAYVHGRYGEFPNAPYYTPNPTPPFGNIVTAQSGNGNNVVFTPEFSGNVAVNYAVPIGASELAVNVSYSYNGGFFFTPDNRVEQEPYSLVNAQIVWTAPSDKYNVRLWVRNLFDKGYLSSGLQGAVGNTVVAATGRTFGASLGFNF